MLEKQPNITKRIAEAALRLLAEHPEGMRFSELLAAIQAADPSFKSNTINGTIWNLEIRLPDKVYKPTRGVYKLVQFKELEVAEKAPPAERQTIERIKEEQFYEPFAEWLKNEIEDVTDAIALGRNVFRDKWGTPDVIGKREPARSDIIKGSTEIVSAEIKIDTAQLVTAFGQACAYKLFSHKAYLVVPRQSAAEEISRVDSLCQIFGIGFVIFNADDPNKPDFQVRVRPSKHEPDLYYTNKYLKEIETDLFR